MSLEADLAARYRDARQRLRPPPARRVAAPLPPLPEIPSGPIREAVAETVARLRVEHASVYVGATQAILRLVSDRTGISVRDIVSHHRQRPLVRARFTAAYLTKEYTNLSLPQIARRIGGRDHTTILHSIRVAERRLREEPEYAEEVASMRLVLDEIFKVSEPVDSGRH